MCAACVWSMSTRYIVLYRKSWSYNYTVWPLNRSAKHHFWKTTRTFLLWPHRDRKTTEQEPSLVNQVKYDKLNKNCCEQMFIILSK